MRSIDNTEDIIDSRDIIERIDELEAEASSVYDEQHPEGVSYDELANLDHCAYLDEGDAEELRSLRELAKDGETNLADWTHGETLIRDSYFEEYARELASDLGVLDFEAEWPLTYIDWPAAAEALKMDYTEIDFDGATYWGRS